DSGEIELEGDPLDPDTAFNSVVYSVTGCSTIEDLRLQFLADVESGDYSFDGFSSYRDNYLTSDIPGVPDISYVSLELPDLSSVPSASAVSGAVSYDNVFSSATVVRSSGYINEGEADSFLVDGSLDTKWCAESGNVTDVSYVVEGVEHFIVLDLGSEVAFDTYTVYNAGSVELSEWNMSSWELLVSSDGTTFYPVDYQESCAMDVASFDIGLTTARYVMLKIYDAEEDGGTVRLYELTAGMR
ncbi:MAG: discoidin domain-containing protein, partial [Clostridiales bacterium]|nr:discoidin domain-containing protein [Clostridiales bacterium]